MLSGGGWRPVARRGFPTAGAGASVAETEPPSLSPQPGLAPSHWQVHHEGGPPESRPRGDARPPGRPVSHGPGAQQSSESAGPIRGPVAPSGPRPAPVSRCLRLWARRGLDPRVAAASCRPMPRRLGAGAPATGPLHRAHWQPAGPVGTLAAWVASSTSDSSCPSIEGPGTCTRRLELPSSRHWQCPGTPPLNPCSESLEGPIDDCRGY